MFLIRYINFIYNKWKKFMFLLIVFIEIKVDFHIPTRNVNLSANFYKAHRSYNKLAKSFIFFVSSQKSFFKSPFSIIHSKSSPNSVIWQSSRRNYAQKILIFHKTAVFFFFVDFTYFDWRWWISYFFRKILFL